VVVVDDGTATMEFVTQLARGERLVRWHRKGGRPGPRDLVFAPAGRRPLRLVVRVRCEVHFAELSEFKSDEHRMQRGASRCESGALSIL
jgi:hypothetical protein